MWEDGELPSTLVQTLGGSASILGEESRWNSVPISSPPLKREELYRPKTGLLSGPEWGGNGRNKGKSPLQTKPNTNVTYGRRGKKTADIFWDR
ncbi:hypothetical protein CEXT_613931 [Caerostris extrusa]|uniref:Uncharacterized protein n=1 Tax=Caerostris extrusa TaxID=172846 RepID=A0AAV4XKI5_CAEEX|nr:hypothetical protein CEXT_613931 [Caerostris extrusa]